MTDSITDYKWRHTGQITKTFSHCIHTEEQYIDKLINNHTAYMQVSLITVYEKRSAFKDN